MAVQNAKAQGYLNKHKIGTLIEEIMGCLIKETPEDPYGCIIRVARAKQSRLVAHGLMKGESPHPLVSQSLDANRSSELSAATSVWLSSAEPFKDTKSHDSKKRSAKDPSNRQVTAEKPAWDKTVKMTNKTFEELLDRGSSQEQKYLKDSGLSFNAVSLINKQKHSSVVTEEELMAKELPLAKEKKVCDVSRTSKVDHRNIKKAGRKARSANHQQDLKRVIHNLQQSQTKSSDSGMDADSDSDEAVELIENSEDLAKEGIAVQTKSTEKRRIHATGPAVTFTICSQCAKLVHGGDGNLSTARSSMVSKATNRGSKAPSTQRSDRSGSSSRTLRDEEDFESVSQVSGQKPRVPVWDDSDDERAASSGKNNKAREFSVSSLKADALRKLPRASNQVEEFLGRQSFPAGALGKPTTMPGEVQGKRSAGRSGASESMDLLASNTQGWPREQSSDVGSTVMDWERNNRQTK